MNKKLAIGLLAAAIAVTGAFYTMNAQAFDRNTAPTQTEQTTPSYVKSVWDNKHLKFQEQGLIDGKLVTTEYEGWFNKNGEFRITTLSGLGAGNFYVWDGAKYYQYNKNANELMIDDYANKTGHPVAHSFLSELIAARTHQAIKENKFTKVKEVTKLGQAAIEYVSVDDLSQDFSETARHQYKDLLKETGNKRETTITFDKDHQYVLEEVTVINGHKTSVLTLTLLEDNKSFDSSLLQIQVPSGTHKVEFK